MKADEVNMTAPLSDLTEEGSHPVEVPNNSSAADESAFGCPRVDLFHVELGGAALMAEIKRASPSKGPIALSINTTQQALRYALGGASVIFVFTEPTWFKGSLIDMLIRRAVSVLPHRRPAQGLYPRPLPDRRSAPVWRRHCASHCRGPAPDSPRRPLCIHP